MSDARVVLPCMCVPRQRGADCGFFTHDNAFDIWHRVDIVVVVVVVFYCAWKKQKRVDGRRGCVEREDAFEKRVFIFVFVFKRGNGGRGRRGHH